MKPRHAFERRTFFRLAKRYTGLLEVEARDLRFLASTEDQFVSARLFEHYERMEMRRLATALELAGERRGTFIDIGANIGTTCLPALAWHGFDKAIAVEPHPENARVLAAAAALNGLQHRVEIVEAAAAAQPGVVRLAVTPTNSGGHYLSEDGALEVTAVRVDDLADPEEVGMIWIDAQESEPSVLAGARRMIEASVPFVCETSDKQDLSQFFPGRKQISLRRKRHLARSAWDDVLFIA